MSNVIFFPNLKAADQRAEATGTIIGSKHCLDVSIANATLPVALTSTEFSEFRFMDMGVTNANASGGAFVQVGDSNFAAAALANSATEMRVNWNGGAAIVISTGADATAAATAANFIAVCGAGQTESFGKALAAGDKIWIRALENAAISAGQLLLKFMG